MEIICGRNFLIGPHSRDYTIGASFVSLDGVQLKVLESLGSRGYGFSSSFVRKMSYYIFMYLSINSVWFWFMAILARRKRLK